MITYTGNPRTLFVYKQAPAGVNFGPLDPRLSIVNHSPTGFAWGYWGSGPAQLAFALIADALASQAMIKDFIPSDVEKAVRRAANPSLYQEFKQRVVGAWRQDAAFEITDAEVLAHVERIERDLQIVHGDLPGTDAGSAR